MGLRAELWRGRAARNNAGNPDVKVRRRFSGRSEKRASNHGFASHESLKEGVAHEFVGSFGEQVVEQTVKWMRVQ